MKKKVFSTLIISLAIAITAQIAAAQIQADGQAGIIITPTRVELDGRQRSASITIANNGNVKGSYRIETVNKRMKEDGSIVDVPEDAKDPEFADKLLRISPRRVTIEPGSNQSIRVLVRKPKDLPDGEYRTHLSVLIVPDEQEPTPTETEKGQLSITVKANYGVTIPIFVTNGTVSSTGKIDNVKYHPGIAEKDSPPRVTFSIARSGKKSLYGDIKVTYANSKGTESVLKFMGGLAIYTPNTIRNFDIPLDVTDNVKIGGGTLKVTYQEKETSGGKIIAQQELKL